MREQEESVVGTKAIARAQLNPDVLAFRDVLSRVFAHLKMQSHPNWYPHASFERRANHEVLINPRSQHFKEDVNVGVMLRIFDGRTLFETATDDLSEAALLTKVDELIQDVRQRGVKEPKKKAYVAPNWSERLAADLDEEIRIQVPKQPGPTTWVHFGTPLKEELWRTPEEMMTHVQGIYRDFIEFGRHLPPTDPAREPDLRSVRLRLADLDFLSIDEAVRMSQALERNAIFLTAVKGDDQGSALRGGVGGRETVHVVPGDYMQAYQELGKMMRAERLKPGRYKVLMAPPITGVFAHEAFGHTQEGDTWARGRSIARELHAENVRVGNEHATIINNPASYQNGDEPFASWGSYYFDEEGWLAQRHELVKEGWLKPPMTNLTSAVRLKVPRTANGKREAWTNGMYTRQTNTYFSEGKSTFDELIAQVDYGFLAGACSGGMEDPRGMGIQVGMAYLEEIRDGRLTGRTFKGPNGGSVQMTGYVPDYLNQIIAKSKIEAFTSEADQARHPWNEVGGCGKYHKEFVVAGCGGPYMLVDQVHLG